jgi:soluble lytic murein transglycosylase-like protein
MMRRTFSLIALLAMSAGAAHAARENIYKYVDRSGVTVYTNIKPAGVNAKVIGTYACPACNVHSTVNWNQTGLNLTAYRDEIAAAAALNAVDESMVRAIIHAESAFHPEALSRAGAQGLMQLMPGTAGMYGVNNAFDPDQNIAAGVKHLSMLLEMFDGDFELAAAGYNAGENAVLRYGGIPPYAETQVYVERVGVLQKRYASEMATAQAKGPDNAASNTAAAGGR